MPAPCLSHPASSPSGSEYVRSNRAQQCSRRNGRHRGPGERERRFDSRFGSGAQPDLRLTSRGRRDAGHAAPPISCHSTHCLILACSAHWRCAAGLVSCPWARAHGARRHGARLSGFSTSVAAIHPPSRLAGPPHFHTSREHGLTARTRSRRGDGGQVR